MINAIGENVKGKMVPIWEKYMLTVDEAVQYFGIGEKKIRMLISENTDTDYCFTVQVGNKSLINRHKFEEFLNQPQQQPVQQQGVFTDPNALINQINILAAQNQELRKQIGSMGVNPVV